ncbi:hypothetical protein ACQKP8_27000 [Photobacterium alginatilyticum]|uniref:hypothetical protein n=1 Tax=Photobacterium alginatilyticum TaxID=1775171 RepID=UPI004067BEEE
MELFADLLVDGEYWVAAAILSLTLFMHLSKIFNFYYSTKKKRSQLISYALSDPNVSDLLKEHLKEEIDTEHFRLTHGISLSTPMLNAVLQIKGRIGAFVSFRHILKVAKAQPDIEEVSSLSFRVKLGRFERFFGVYNLIAGFVLMTVGIVSGVLFFYTMASGLQLSSLVLCVLSIPLGCYLLNDGSTLVSVYHVNQALEHVAKNADGKSL